MSEPFLGEIRVFAMNFAPKGWAQCNGQLLPINQNQALFSIIGNQFGGDGRTNFALPDLRGRAPIHSQNSAAGQAGGEEAHVLTVGEIPAHNHQATAGTDATSGSAGGTTWGSNSNVTNYAPQANALMSTNALATTGQSQAHPNMQPYLVVNYCIATQGIFPSRN